MTDDLDHLLERLAARPVHPRLDAVTASVLEQLPAASAPRSGNVMLAGVVAGLIAAGVGIVGGLSQPAQAHRSAGFDPGRALAPSTLLGGG